MDVVEGSAKAKHAARHRPGRRSAGRRAVQDRPGDVVGPHPPQQAAALRAQLDGDADALAVHGGDLVHVRVTNDRAALDAGRVGRDGSPGTPAADSHPGSSRLTRHLALVGPTASGKSALALAIARARGRRRDRVARLDAGVPRPRHRDRQTDPRRASPRSCTISSTSPIRAEEWSVQRTQVCARAAIADIEARGQRALLVGGHRSLRAGGGRRSADPADRSVDSRPARCIGAEATPASVEAYRRLIELDPVAAARMEPGNRRRIVRALEVIELTGRQFSSFGPGIDEYPAAGDLGDDATASRSRLAMLAARIASPVRRDASHRPRRRGPGVGGSSGRGRCRARPARRSGTASCSRTSRVRFRHSTTRSTPRSGARAASPAGSASWFGRDPRVQLDRREHGRPPISPTRRCTSGATRSRCGTAVS